MTLTTKLAYKTKTSAFIQMAGTFKILTILNPRRALVQPNIKSVNYVLRNAFIHTSARNAQIK